MNQQHFEHQISKGVLAALILRYVAAGICVWLLTGCSAPGSAPSSGFSTPGSISGTGTNFVEDPKNSPFADYDSNLMNSITRRWDDLLNSKQFPYHRTGKVVVRFHLHANGTVSDLVILENNVGALLGYVCENAITHSAPFGPWPSDMEKMVGMDYREVIFTFYYNGK